MLRIVDYNRNLHFVNSDHVVRISAGRLENSYQLIDLHLSDGGIINLANKKIRSRQDVNTLITQCHNEIYKEEL